MPEAASWSAFHTHWLALHDTLAAPPCLLIDAAGVPGHAQGIPMAALSPCESLFEGDLADECAHVGPWLGQAASWADDVARALWPLIDRREAMLVWPQPAGDATLDWRALRRHLRKFNVVYSERGQPHQFRYYDARVLLTLLESATRVTDLQALLKPFAGLLTVDGADELRLITLRDGRIVAAHARG